MYQPTKCEQKHNLLGIYGVCFSRGKQCGVQGRGSTRTQKNAGNTKQGINSDYGDPPVTNEKNTEGSNKSFSGSSSTSQPDISK